MAIKSGMVPRDQLQLVLNLVQQIRHMDFGGYKRSTLQRRIEHRMRERKFVKVADYCEILRQEPAELDTLVSALLIKVTEFFRDPPLWDALRKSVLPEIMAHANPGGEVRIWSAGCATGEEAYSIAMLMDEMAGKHSEYSHTAFRVFGTDRDAGAIVAARRGFFSHQQMEGVDQQMAERWFERTDDGYVVRKEVRRYVVFGVQDVINDAPISRLDLILCRNVFIYLDTISQRRAMLKFHHALKPGGILALGKSELLSGAERFFSQVDLANRVYRKVIIDPGPGAYPVFDPAVPRHFDGAETALSELSNDRIAREVFSMLNVAVVVVSREGIVTQWNQPAARLWGRSEGEVLGKSLSGIRFEGAAGERLRERAAAMRSGHMTEETVEIDDSENHRAIRFVMRPLAGGAQGVSGYMCIAQDVTELHNAVMNLHIIEQRERELTEKYKSAIGELQSTNEALEATNEELQSANEELQTTNEELQSTNEELETINEELESTNASFDSVNNELNQRTEQLTWLSLSQRAIIGEISSVIIAFDPEDRVELWNPAAEILLRRTEEQVRGQPLKRLSLLPLPRSVANRLKAALRRKAALAMPPFDCVVGGRKVQLRCSVTPLVSATTYHGTMLIIEPARASRLLRVTPAGRTRKARKTKKGGSSTS